MAAAPGSPKQAALLQEQQGLLYLPESCLGHIIACLAATLEPGGLRGPSAVARDLGTAALVCRDFHRAVATQGYQALGKAATAAGQVPPPHRDNEYLRVPRALHSLPGPAAAGLSWELWDAVVQRPEQLEVLQLRAAARHLGVAVGGWKVELVWRVLRALGLTARTRAPAALLRALALERCYAYVAWDGPDALTAGAQLILDILALPLSHPVHQQSSDWRQVSAAELRARIARAGFASIGELRAAAAVEREQAGLQEPRHGEGRKCIVPQCSNKAATACTRSRCVNCCLHAAGPPCQRHNNV